MDEQRFDDLARGLAGAGWSRRGLARALTGAVFIPLLGWVAPQTPAKKKRGKKKKGKACKNGAIKCSNACVNPETNALHCGRCGRSCGIDVACVNGVCEGGGCPDDQILCGTLCVDPDDDDAHCGRCNNPCNGDLTCIDGACGCASAAKCGNQCVDTQIDPDHCGQCDDPCNSGETCVGGQCKPAACGPGQRDCGDGLCIPEGDDACCVRLDCGPSRTGNEILCNLDTHRCQCETTGRGICSRHSDGGGTCAPCCPGGKDLGENCTPNARGDRICLAATFDGCSCPPTTPVTCPHDPEQCSRNIQTDPRACGQFCEDCAIGHICCRGLCLAANDCNAGA